MTYIIGWSNVPLQMKSTFQDRLKSVRLDLQEKFPKFNWQPTPGPTSVNGFYLRKDGSYHFWYEHFAQRQGKRYRINKSFLEQLHHDTCHCFFGFDEKRSFRQNSFGDLCFFIFYEKTGVVFYYQAHSHIGLPCYLLENIFYDWTLSKWKTFCQCESNSQYLYPLLVANFYYLHWMDLAYWENCINQSYLFLLPFYKGDLAPINSYDLKLYIQSFLSFKN